MTEEEAQAALEMAKTCMEEEVTVLRKDCDATQKVLTDLKVQLYAKFGDNINLEAD
jgi:prefoldin subunit 4